MQAILENTQLKNKLPGQEVDLAHHKLLISQVNLDPPTRSSEVTIPVNSDFYPLEVNSEIWSWGAKGPATKNLLQMYEVQSQLFSKLTSLAKFTWINHNCFLKWWKHSLEWGVENLFVKILAHRHINLSDPYYAFIVIGDFGARILLYYASLENQWLLRHQFPIPAERGEVSWQEYGNHVTSQFYSQPLGNL